MPRIRTIKPEFWDSPSVAKASPWARLLFIAMWNWADDHGRGTANLKELEGFAFPHDDTFTDRSGNTVHFRSLVAEVSACFGVVFYEAEKRPFYVIPTWDAHQRNERRAARSKYPDPPVIPGQNGFVAEIPCISAQVDGVSGTGTGEQGNRGTGEQVSAQPKVARAHVDDLFDQFWAAWPLKKGKQAARKAFDKAIKTTTLEQILKGVEQYKREIGPSPDWSKVKWPQGWLNDARWEDEPAPVAQSTNQPAPYTADIPTCKDGHRWLPNNTCMHCTERRTT